MLEIEMKFPVADREQLRTKLEALGARLRDVHDEVDHYFNAPDRDFARTDEALRLRRIGDTNLLTYKGPKLDAQTKTRVEVEVPLGDGEASLDHMAELLAHLKYRPVAVLRKKRTLSHLEYGGFPVEVCLDAVDGLGAYVELEIMAPESELNLARQAVLGLARWLGLGETERRSYLEMWLEKHGKT